MWIIPLRQARVGKRLHEERREGNPPLFEQRQVDCRKLVISAPLVVTLPGFPFITQELNVLADFVEVVPGYFVDLPTGTAEELSEPEYGFL